MADNDVKGKKIAILVVDDDPETKDKYINKLAASGVAQDGISVLSKSYGPEISTSQYYQEALNEGFVIAAIIMDGNWKWGEEIGFNISAIKTLRQQGYMGPIIAASSSQTINKELLKAGADRSISEDLPDDYDRKLDKMIAVPMAIKYAKEMME